MQVGYSNRDIVNVAEAMIRKPKMNPRVKTQIFGSLVKNEMKLFTGNRNNQSKNIFTQVH
jgi:hypothetical protein